MPRADRRPGQPRQSPVIKALVFDFDGLMLETELPVYQSWQAIYREHGVELPLATWLETIGTADHPFDPFEHLQELVGRQLDREPIDARRKQLRDSILHAQTILPGVDEVIRGARALGLKLGIASSSRRAWVVGHLARLGIADGWDAVRCADDVSRTKPDPELYRAVVEALRVAPAEAVALEDSQHGLAAAKAAGMRCIAVPGPMTLGMDFSAADIVLTSLAEVPLEVLLRRLDGGDAGPV